MKRRKLSQQPRFFCSSVSMLQTRAGRRPQHTDSPPCRKRHLILFFGYYTAHALVTGAAATRKLHALRLCHRQRVLADRPRVRDRRPRAAASTAVGVERRFRGDHFVAHFLAANVEAPIVVYTPLCPVLLKDAAAERRPTASVATSPTSIHSAGGEAFPGRKEPMRTFTCEWSATVGDEYELVSKLGDDLSCSRAASRSLAQRHARLLVRAPRLCACRHPHPLCVLICCASELVSSSEL